MPKPTKFLTDGEIEERAAEVLDAHVEGGRKALVLPIDVDTLTECDFRFRVSREPLEDPSGCRTYAMLLPEAGCGLYVARLILNENFRRFLTDNPGVERLTRGHELCHWVVHVDEGKLRSGNLPFDSAEPPVRYHRTHYSDGTLTTDRVNRLAVFALKDDRAYRTLKRQGSDPEACIEPAWMHRQAEHFSACLLVPRAPLFAMLEGGADPSHYSTHVRLAEMFQVSKRVIQIRLKKLGIIEEIEPGRFRNVRGGDRFEFN